MENVRSVALVGRPNVGKSRLFNRLVGKRLAIVHNQPGVTRDVMAEEVNDDFILMDTGGIGMKPTEMSTEEINLATEEQVAFAIQASNIVLFVVDGREGLTHEDKVIAEQLRKVGRRILVVVNKVDNENDSALIDPFFRLGLGEPMWVSAEHGLETGSLREKIIELLGPKPEVEVSGKKERIKICFAGRPNAGKSSLSNRLLKSERMIVSSMPGTTRDSVQADLDYKTKDGQDWNFCLIDTAGVKPKAKIHHSVEYFSGLRTQQSIERADVVFLVIDALEGVAKQDKKLAAAILEAGRAIVVIVNKWDYALEQFRREPLERYKDEKAFKKAYEKAVRDELFALPGSPVVFTSATEGFGVESILHEAKAIFARSHKKLPTSKINDVIQGLIEAQKPRSISGKRFKIYYCVQVCNNPLKIKIFCNRIMRLEAPYERYLAHGINTAFELAGCPVKFELIGKPSRTMEKV